MKNYEKNFDEVLQKIEKARVQTNEYNIIKLVAISKYVTSKEIQELYQVGQRAFGENKVQDLKQKANELQNLPLEWHFVGRVQKNKINHLLELSPSLIQSCDSFELALAIDKRVKNDKKVPILLQINSAKEESKAGVMPEVAKEIYHQIKQECPNLLLKGVMSIGAHSDNQKEIEKSFKTTYKIFEDLKPLGAEICSMGMSGDFELAIKCGSNMLRLGSLLFNPIA